MVRQYDAQLMCDNEHKKHKLWEQGWRTVFTKSEKFLGRCWHDSKRIEISLVHLNTRSEAELYDTILHEIAHALVDEVGHGPLWKEKAISIGLKFGENKRGPEVCGDHIDRDKGKGLEPSEAVSYTHLTLPTSDLV